MKKSLLVVAQVLSIIGSRRSYGLDRWVGRSLSNRRNFWLDRWLGRSLSNRQHFWLDRWLGRSLSYRQHFWSHCWQVHIHPIVLILLAPFDNAKLSTWKKIFILRRHSLVQILRFYPVLQKVDQILLLVVLLAQVAGQQWKGNFVSRISGKFRIELRYFRRESGEWNRRTPWWRDAKLPFRVHRKPKPVKPEMVSFVNNNNCQNFHLPFASLI